MVRGRDGARLTAGEAVRGKPRAQLLRLAYPIVPGHSDGSRLPMVKVVLPTVCLSAVDSVEKMSPGCVMSRCFTRISARFQSSKSFTASPLGVA